MITRYTTDYNLKDMPDAPYLVEILDTLGKVFPGGYKTTLDISKQGRGPETAYQAIQFQIGTHSIFFRDSQNTLKQPCIEVTWTLMGKVDTCDLRTMDDLVGWVSCLRADIEDAAIRKLLQYLEPQKLDISNRHPLKEAWHTIKACGESDLYIANQLAQEASIPWMCEDWHEEHRMRVGVLGHPRDGHITGYLKPDEPATPIWILDYACMIPTLNGMAGEESSIQIPDTSANGDRVELIKNAKNIMGSVYFQVLGDIINDRLTDKG